MFDKTRCISDTDAAQLSARPSLPPTFWALLCIFICVHVYLQFSLKPVRLLEIFIVCVAVGVIAAVIFIRLRLFDTCSFVVLLLLSLALASLISAGEITKTGRLRDLLSSTSVSLWEFKIIGDMSRNTYGCSGTAQAIYNGEVKGSVWISADEAFEAGSVVSGVGRFSVADTDEWGISLTSRAIPGTVRIITVLSQKEAGGILGCIYRMRKSVLAHLDVASSAERALIAGIVCGYKTELATFGIRDLFATCGVSHMIAVSGTHIVLASSIILTLLSKTKLSPLARGIIVMITSLCFVLFCAAPSSAIRAWIMTSTSTLSDMVFRRDHKLSALSLAGIIMICIKPGLVGEIGFLLSLTCVASIYLFGRYVRYVLNSVVPQALLPAQIPAKLRACVYGFIGTAEEICSISLVCQLSCVLITGAVYSEISLIAPLSNVALSGLFSLILFLGLIAVLLNPFAGAQYIILKLCDGAAKLFLSILKLLARIPFATLPLDISLGAACGLTGIGMLVLLVLWPTLSKRSSMILKGMVCILVAFGFSWYLYWRLFAPASISVLDVGQGDAILIRDARTAVLVDTGPDDAVIRELYEQHVYHLDAVIITHLHEDHTGGLGYVIDTYDPDVVLVGEGVQAYCAWDTDIREISYGDSIIVGNYSLTMLWPLSATDGSENDDSVVLSILYKTKDISFLGLLTGDAESDVLTSIIESNDIGDVVFLKVGHHGSKASLTEEIALSLMPEISVASAGAENSYGHPAQECVTILENVGSVFLCTKDAGTVNIVPTSGGCRVVSEYQ